LVLSRARYEGEIQMLRRQLEACGIDACGVPSGQAGMPPPPPSQPEIPPHGQMIQGPPPQAGPPQQPPFLHGYPGPVSNGMGPPQSAAIPFAGAAQGMSHGQPVNVGDIDVDQIPKHHKKQGDDWVCVFSQNLPRNFDIDLVHTLTHDSVVCCVRFSADGKYVAAGCNKSAQIYDVQTGEKLCVLQDNSVDISGDLYIRSVCFSPDGRYLAAGAEDKLIRVSRKCISYSSKQ
jgi:general transcriptional corepressor TUP1